MNQTKNIIKENYVLILAFIVFILITLFLFQKIKQEKINTHLENTKQMYNVQFSRTYESFKKLSENTFYGIINKPEVYNNVKNAYKKNLKTQSYYRNKLNELFKADYSRLIGFNFKQIHFHFPDNTSFLRMHKPSKFGDDLTLIRESVRIVNKTFKSVEGFEMGKVVHGFRFVYPLSDENLNHIGSVEVSIASEFFETYYEHHFNADVHFLTQKKILKEKLFFEEYVNQIASFENEDYTIYDSGKEQLHFTTNDYFSVKELSTIKQKMENNENFILSKKDNDKYATITFIPIENIAGIKNSAYIVVYTLADYIQQIHQNYYKVYIIVVLLIIIFISFLYQKYKSDQRDKQKNIILSQQSKMASMGEMISNIAHQWRQPLSVISTAATGMEAQKEFGMLTDEVFKKNIKQIYESTEYLSETIEDFRNYFSSEEVMSIFTLKNAMKESLKIFGNTLQEKNISIVQNIEDIEIQSYKNELKQVLIHLIKNALDAIKQNGVIIITIKRDEKNIIITIQDSGGGIPHKIIDRIFEPYFTTKHKSQGTGLGLYMSHEIITKSLLSKIEVKNIDFTYNFVDYHGACFKITITK